MQNSKFEPFCTDPAKSRPENPPISPSITKLVQFDAPDPQLCEEKPLVIFVLLMRG